MIIPMATEVIDAVIGHPATALVTASDVIAVALAPEANPRRRQEARLEVTEVGVAAGAVNILADTHVVIEEGTEIIIEEAVPVPALALRTAITDLTNLAVTAIMIMASAVAKKMIAEGLTRNLAHGRPLHPS
jgi:hypothetical protein